MWTGGADRQRIAVVHWMHKGGSDGGASLCHPAQRNHMNSGKTGIPGSVNLGNWGLVERVLALGFQSPKSWLLIYCVTLGKSLHISEPKKGENVDPYGSRATRARTRVRTVRHSPRV